MEAGPELEVDEIVGQVLVLTFDENGTSCILRFAMQLLIKSMVDETQIKSANENNKVETWSADPAYDTRKRVQMHMRMGD